MDTSYLARLTNGEYPSGASTLFHVPQEPQGELNRFRGHIIRRDANCRAVLVIEQESGVDTYILHMTLSLKNIIQYNQKPFPAFKRKYSWTQSLTECRFLTLGENNFFLTCWKLWVSSKHTNPSAVTLICIPGSLTILFSLI